MKIRNYTKEDFNTVISWWKSIGQHGPTEKQLPEESSFVLEINDKPVLMVSAYLTNTDVAYLENLISDPEFKQDRKQYTQLIMDHLFNFVKSKGYKYAVSFTTHEKLVKRNLNIGFDKAVDNLYLLAKEL